MGYVRSVNVSSLPGLLTLLFFLTKGNGVFHPSEPSLLYARLSDGEGGISGPSFPELQDANGRVPCRCHNVNCKLELSRCVKPNVDLNVNADISAPYTR